MQSLTVCIFTHRNIYSQIYIPQLLLYHCEMFRYRFSLVLCSFGRKVVTLTLFFFFFKRKDNPRKSRLCEFCERSRIFAKIERHSQRIFPVADYRMAKYARMTVGMRIGVSRLVAVPRVIGEESDGGCNVKEDVERIFLDKWLSRSKRKRRERARARAPRERDECTRWGVGQPLYRHKMHFLRDLFLQNGA